MNNFILAQIVGVFIIITNSISSFSKEKRKLFLFNAVSNFLCVVQYFLLGAYTGIICCVIAILRNIIFSRYKDDVPIYILILFIIICVSVNLFFVRNIFDIIPIINIIVYACGIRKKDIKATKKCTIFTGITGITYDLVVGAYTGVLLNLSDFLGGLYGTITMKGNKNDGRNKNKKSK